MLFGSVTQEPRGLPKIWCYFCVPWTIYYMMHILFFRTYWWFWGKAQKHVNLGVGGAHFTFRNIDLNLIIIFHKKLEVYDEK